MAESVDVDIERTIPHQRGDQTRLLLDFTDGGIPHGGVRCLDVTPRLQPALQFAVQHQQRLPIRMEDEGARGDVTGCLDGAVEGITFSVKQCVETFESDPFGVAGGDYRRQRRPQVGTTVAQPRS